MIDLPGHIERLEDRLQRLEARIQEMPDVITHAVSMRALMALQVLITLALITALAVDLAR